MSHSTDNVAACRYTVPDYWTIGEVYERLIEDVTGEDEDDEHLIDHLMEVYTSWIDDAISRAYLKTKIAQKVIICYTKNR